MRKKFFISITVFLALLGFAPDARAYGATLFLVPEKKTARVGEELIVDVKIKTEEVFINATQATIQFPEGILELTEAVKTGSAFSFWVEDPVISNEDGTLTFISGTSKGISGGSLQVLKLKFKILGTGIAELAITDAAVTASDGKGTNTLSTVAGTAIAIGPNVVKPESAPPTAPTSTEPQKAAAPLPAAAPIPAPVELPQKVVRKAVSAKELPAKPNIRVPLYSDQLQWYSHVAEVVALWDVPADVTQLAAALDKNPNTEPKAADEELFTGKSFAALTEGVWYAHVRFRNNVGWGPVAHYKISLDTTPPLPFEVQIDAAVSDNPQPTIQYETHDSLSGISRTAIFVDDKEPIQSNEAVTVLSPQPAGTHAVRVQIFDLAGNSVEDDLEFEVLPLPTPTIEFITAKASQDEGMFMWGKALPNVFIDIRVLNKLDQEVFKDTATSDGLGNWNRIIEEPFSTGKYTLSVIARDERGAVSYPSEVKEFKIQPKTIFSFGPIDLGWLEILIAIVLFAASGIGIAAWYVASTRQTREAYRVIIGRDIDKLTSILSGHLEELGNVRELNDSARAAKTAAVTGKMKDTIAKMRKYLGEEVEKLK